MQKTKAAVGVGIIGIGTILVLTGLLSKVSYENCIVESRASLDDYDTPRRIQAGTPTCPPDYSGFLFIGPVVTVAGVVVLIAGLTDASLLSLSRKG